MPDNSPSWQAHTVNVLPDPIQRLTHKIIPVYKIMTREKQFVQKKKHKTFTKGLNRNRLVVPNFCLFYVFFLALNMNKSNVLWGPWFIYGN